MADTTKYILHVDKFEQSCMACIFDIWKCEKVPHDITIRARKQDEISVVLNES